MFNYTGFEFGANMAGQATVEHTRNGEVATSS